MLHVLLPAGQRTLNKGLGKPELGHCCLVQAGHLQGEGAQECEAAQQ
jgi:hypothetical protein